MADEVMNTQSTNGCQTPRLELNGMESRDALTSTMTAKPSTSV
jgi:hypothetical protein